jgi:hypothetical protein
MKFSRGHDGGRKKLSSLRNEGEIRSRSKQLSKGKILVKVYIFLLILLA